LFLTPRLSWNAPQRVSLCWNKNLLRFFRGGRREPDRPGPDRHVIVREARRAPTYRLLGLPRLRWPDGFCRARYACRRRRRGAVVFSDRRNQECRRRPFCVRPPGARVPGLVSMERFLRARPAGGGTPGRRLSRPRQAGGPMGRSPPPPLAISSTPPTPLVGRRTTDASCRGMPPGRLTSAGIGFEGRRRSRHWDPLAQSSEG